MNQSVQYSAFKYGTKLGLIHSSFIFCFKLNNFLRKKLKEGHCETHFMCIFFLLRKISLTFYYSAVLRHQTNKQTKNNKKQIKKVHFAHFKNFNFYFVLDVITKNLNKLNKSRKSFPQLFKKKIFLT